MCSNYISSIGAFVGFRVFLDVSQASVIRGSRSALLFEECVYEACCILSSLGGRLLCRSSIVRGYEGGSAAMLVFCVEYYLLGHFSAGGWAEHGLQTSRAC